MVAKAMFLGQKLFSKHIIVMHGQVHQYKRVLSYCLKTNKSDNVNYNSTVHWGWELMQESFNTK